MQIMAELIHNQIRLYPFDAEENDHEELQLNERIRVNPLFVPGCRFTQGLYRKKTELKNP